MAQLMPPPQHPRGRSNSEDSGGVAPKLPFHHGLGMARPKPGPTPAATSRTARTARARRDLQRPQLTYASQNYTGWAAAHAEAPDGL